MSVINGQLPHFPFFYFYLSSLPRLCRYVWDLLGSATPQSAKEWRPTKLVFFCDEFALEGGVQCGIRADEHSGSMLGHCLIAQWVLFLFCFAD